MPRGEGAFGVAKAIPVIVPLISAIVFCAIWFPANLGVLLWQRHKNGNWRCSAYSIPVVLLSAIAFFVCAFRVGSTWIPAQHQERMRQSYESLAGQPKIELKSVKYLIDSYCTESQRGVNPQPPSGKYGAVRILIANPATPPEVFNYLADNLDDSSVVLWFMAGCSNCPQRLISRFLSIPSVHEFLAVNPAASPQMLESLSHSTNWHVRDRVAQNGNTPKTILEQLANDPKWTVSDSAKRNLKLLSSRP
jgi:hypothetical protein